MEILNIKKKEKKKEETKVFNFSSKAVFIIESSTPTLFLWLTIVLQYTATKSHYEFANSVNWD